MEICRGKARKIAIHKILARRVPECHKLKCRLDLDGVNTSKSNYLT